MTRSIAWAAWLCLLPLYFAPAQAVEVKIWSASTEAEFAPGTLEGVAIDTEGGVRLAPSQQTLWGPEEGIVWSVQPVGDGAALVALSGPGRVLRVAAGLPAVTLYEAAGESLITAMIGSGDGGAFVGLSPEGQVLRVGQAGGASVIAETGATFVWAVARAADGTLWIGTGIPGRLLRVRPGEEAETIFDSGDDPVRCIALLEDGAVVAGTGGRGRVIRFDREGKPFVLLDADESEVVAVAAGAGGALFALTASGQKQPSAKRERDEKPVQVEGGAMRVVVTAEADDSDDEKPEPAAPPSEARPARRFTALPGGALYRVDPGGAATKIWESELEMPFGMVARDDGTLLVATGDKGRIWALDGDGNASQLLRIPSNQASAMAQAPQGGVLVGGSTDARVVLLSGDDAEGQGSYLGPAVDAGATADWGRVRWIAELPSGSKLRVFVRAGNSAEADGTWTDWNELPAKSADEGQVAGLPPTRWFQVRVDLVAGKEGSPLLRGIELRYQPRNRAPELTDIVVEPPGAVRIQGPVQGSNRTGPLVADDPVSRRSAAALTRNGAAPRALRRAYEAGARTFTWRGADPDGDRLRYRLEIRSAKGGAWFPLAEDLSESFYSWDARWLEDGDYRVRLIADDSLDNAPGTELSATRTSTLFPVDNSRPRVESLEIDGGESGWQVRFVALDPGGAVTAVQVSIDGAPWVALLPADGVADSARESYELTVPGGEKEATAAVRVRVVDAAGNLGGAMWSVPAP